MDTLAASYLSSASATSGSTAEAAALMKDTKYSATVQLHVFVPLVIDTFGSINLKELQFLSEFDAIPFRTE